jgi:hypothetical protein
MTTAVELSDITEQSVARAAVVRCLALVQEMLQGTVGSQSGSLEDLRRLARDLGGAARLASVVGLAAVAEVDRRGIAAHRGYSCTEALMAYELNLSPDQASERVRLARTLFSDAVVVAHESSAPQPHAGGGVTSSCFSVHV